MGYNIFRRIFNWKKKEEQAPQEETLAEAESPEGDISAQITFSIHTDGETSIDCFWDDNRKDTAYRISELLVGIKRGVYYTALVELLYNHLLENPEDDAFLAQVVEYVEKLDALYEMEQNVEKPFVSPTQVFRNSE
jgi:hypothetical protein